MTDVVFLLLVFFMVTSTFVFPTALEVDLPRSDMQTPAKPSTRIFIDSDGGYWISMADSEPASCPADSLVPALKAVAQADSAGAVAVYADVAVPYGLVVEVLNAGADCDVKMVLATRPVGSASNTPTLP